MPQTYVEVVIPPAVPVEGVYVALHGVGGVLLNSGFTDAAGLVFLGDRPAGPNYEIRVSATAPLLTGAGNRLGAIIPNQVAPVVFTVPVADPALPLSVDAGRCLCTGRFETLGGRPLVTTLMFTGPEVDQTSGVDDVASARTREVSGVRWTSVDRSHEVRSTEDGVMTLSLIRGKKYLVSDPGTIHNWRIYVPDSPSADLSKVLYPRVAGVVWYDAGVEMARINPALALAVGEEKELTAKILLSSGALIDVAGAIKSSDPTVATVVGTYVLTGVAPGVATMSLSADVAVLGILPEAPLSGELTVTVA